MKIREHPADRATGRFDNVKSSYGLFLALGIILVIALFVNIFAGLNFFKISNLSNVSRSTSILGVVSVGQLLVIISGGLDLSVGAVMSTADVLAAGLMEGSNALVWGVSFLCILMGALVGLANGLLITKRRVPPFIATLGMSIILKGARLIFTKGAPKGDVPDLLRFFGIGKIRGIPSIVFVFVAVAVLIAVLLNRTGYGRRLYLTGSNVTATRLCGVKTDRVIIIAYMVCSATAALGGLLIAAYTGTADNWAGRGFDLDSIAAVVLGGAVIGGGIGTALGTIIGVIIMVILVNLLLLANMPVQSQMLAKGLVLLAAVWINNRRNLVRE